VDRIFGTDWHNTRQRHPLPVVLLAALLIAVPALQTVLQATTRFVAASVSVILRADNTQDAHAAAAAVTAAGGQVVRTLDIIDGVEAVVPRDALRRLAARPGVLGVTPNGRLHLLSTSFDPVGDVGSAFNTTKMTGAQTYWANGYTGKGVDVALIDSGVVPVNGLTAPGKVVNGVDLSFESQVAGTTYLDTFGHGTHMAGIIAGRDDAATGYVGDSADFVGMAPDARVVNVKVADSHGATDVSQVIAAIDWVVQHRNDNGMNIRVLNLSFGTDSSQSYTLDPLAYAAEVAWRNGIVVVAAAGNAGFAPSGSLADPANDPYVLAVGAADTQATTATADDTVATFSQTGVKRKPDLVAPGVHVVSLRDPGSYIDQTYGGTGLVGTRFFRGSGTSQATAVVSGAAALLLSQRPWLTPDQVKQILDGTATQVNNQSVNAQGNGELNLDAALTAVPPTSPQNWTKSTGTGSLESARGSVHLVMDGVTLQGEQDIMGRGFNSANMAAAEANSTSWSGGVWNSTSWSGSDWGSTSWSGASWSSTSWSSTSWSSTSWSSVSWSSASWSSASWSSTSWSSASWSSASWSGYAWSSTSWSSASWSSASWSTAGWNDSDWS
jgi:serine protease AprX